MNGDLEEPRYRGHISSRAGLQGCGASRCSCPCAHRLQQRCRFGLKCYGRRCRWENKELIRKKAEDPDLPVSCRFLGIDGPNGIDPFGFATMKSKGVFEWTPGANDCEWRERMSPKIQNAKARRAPRPTCTGTHQRLEGKSPRSWRESFSSRCGCHHLRVPRMHARSLLISRVYHVLNVV